MELSKIYMSQKYHWHMMIEAEWEDQREKNSPSNIFPCFSHYFQLSFDETSFLCNKGKLKILGGKDKPFHAKDCIESRISITFLCIGSAAGVNG